MKGKAILTLRRSAEQSLEGLADAETDASRHGCAVHLSMREKWSFDTTLST